MVEVRMPQITMTMVEGVISEWLKEKGDTVTKGEPLVNIETDKVVQTLNASDSGVLLDITAQPGDVVPVGDVICVVGSAGEKVESAPAPVQAAEEEPKAPAASSGKAVRVEMPPITMTMVEGVISQWHKKKGDAVKEGEPLVDIETDKVVQTLNASASGILLEVLAEEGDIVPVGQVFCTIGEPGAAAEAAPAPAAAPKAAQTAPQSAAAGEVVLMPKVTKSMKDAVVIRWLVSEGDTVAKDEPIFTAEVDDTRRTVGAPEAGVVQKIIAHSGSTVYEGSPLYETSAKAASAAPAAEPAKRSGYIYATPLAKAFASSIGMDLSIVTPTGPDGLIVESDVKKAVVTPQTAPLKKPAAQAAAAASDEEFIPFVGIRKRIADNLMLTKQTMADVTTFAEINMSRIKTFRESLHVSYNAFILRAAALALMDYPIMNSSIRGDKIVVKKTVGLSVAVSTKRGLVTPVLHNAEKLNIISIAEKLEDYAVRGRDGKLTPEDFEGGTFTVTNSGTYGALFFTPIINSPQSAILGVGKIMMTPIVDEEGRIVAAPMMIGCLSYDHRVVDGETAVKFLQRVKFYLEHPDQMTVIKKK